MLVSRDKAGMDREMTNEKCWPGKKPTEPAVEQVENRVGVKTAKLDRQNV